jgi:hypothetical protein
MSGPPPRDISQDDEITFVADPEVPQPGQDIGSSDQNEAHMNNPASPPRDASNRHHERTSHQSPPRPVDNRHSPPTTPVHQQHHRQNALSHNNDHHHQHGAPPPQQMRPDYPVARPIDVPPNPYTVNPPPFPYDQPHFDEPYGHMGRPMVGPWLQDPGIRGPPLVGPHQWMPPPRHAEFHHTHQQIRRRVPRRTPPPLPVRMAPPMSVTRQIP